ncbi:diacylglycerol/lipid kinase family protein [Methylomagnum sp.]
MPESHPFGGEVRAPRADHGSIGPIGADSPLYVILNAGSGRDDPLEVRRQIEPVFGAAGRPHSIRLVHDPRELPPIAAETVALALRNHGLVVAAGGDGAINAVVQQAWPHGCPIGVLPQGTFNYFARTHGIPEEPGQAARLLLEGEPQPVQVGLVNDRVFLVNASLGLYPELLETREAFKRQFGRRRPVAMLASAVALLRRHRVLRIILETRSATRSLWTPTLFVGNNALQLEQIGLPEHEKAGAGELVAVMLHPIGKAAMVGLMWRGALGNLGEAGSILSFPFRGLRVWPSLFARHRIKVATDGEIDWLRTPLHFRVAPKPLYLVKPAR